MKRIRLASIVFALAALAASVLAASASAKPTYSYAFSAGSEGSGKGQFKNPGALTVDGEGNVWVADTGNKRLEKFNSKGEFLLEVKEGIGGSAISPNDITVDSKGSVWALDENSDKAVKYTSAGYPQGGVGGELKGEYGENKGSIMPTAFTSDSKGNFWFADFNGRRVVQVEPPNEKHWWSQWMSEFHIEVGGPKGGEFYEPTGMAFDSEGSLWISDPGTFASSVQKFNTSGTFLSRAGEGYLGWAEGRPWFDSEKNLWVANCGESSAVMAFNPKTPGAPLNQFGEHGYTEGKVGCAADIAADSNGNLWVLDSGRDLIQKWTAAPAATTEAPTGVSTSEATLNGSVNPRGLETTYQFEYSTGSGWVKAGSAKSAGSGTETVKESLKITGLEADTLYRFHISATNSHGTTNGEDKTFATGSNQWSRESTPEASGTSPQLTSVSCLSAEACMAVGNYSNGSGVGVTLAKVKSGGNWSLTSTSNPSSTSNSLSDVSCSAASSCTAVGSYNGASGNASTLAERWNGTGWALQTTPNPSGTTANNLYGVACAATNECTAVGLSYKEGGGTSTLIERWNGASWSIVTSPNPEGFKEAELYDISCVSASDCWAVGKAKKGIGFPEAGLIEHWNGSAWSINSYSELPGHLLEVACGSTSSCLAVTGYDRVVARWNGSAWSQETAPAAPDANTGKKGEQPPSGELTGASCISASSCVLTGKYVTTSLLARPLALGWDGSKWSVQTTSFPPVESSIAVLNGVSCTTATSCTGVGSYNPKGGNRKDLVETRQ
jgi:sugar lactone lactonase YvrE